LSLRLYLFHTYFCVYSIIIYFLLLLLSSPRYTCLDGIGKGSPNEQTLFLMLNGWNNLVHNVANLQQGMDAQSAGEQMFRDALGTTISDLQGAIDLTDGKVKILGARVGDVPKTAADPTITIWEAITAIQASIEATNVLLTSRQSDASEQEDKLRTTDNRLHILSQSYGNLAESYKRQITRLNGSVSTLEKAAGMGRRANTSGLSRGEPGRFDFNGTSVDDALTILQEMQEKVEHLTGATNQHVGQDAFRRIVQDV
jgi:hypothetical protein